MDLSYGPRYESFRREVRNFLDAHRDEAPRGEGLRSGKTLAWQKRLIERGYAARTIPREYGGYGAEPDILESRIIAEEFAAAQVSPGLGGQGISMLVPTLLEMGSESQKREFIGPTLRGELVWCQGYSEPGAGSDLASLTTRADLVRSQDERQAERSSTVRSQDERQAERSSTVRSQNESDGDEWVVNGQKIWTSTAHLADWIFCLVRTEPDAPKHQGISFLLFRMDSPGIEVRPLVDMTGAANFNEVFFTDVRVPKDQIVGERGQGWMVANAILRHERDSLGNPDATLSRLNALILLMRRTTLGGRPLLEHPVYRDRLMKIQARVMAMRCNDLRILSARINGADAGLARMIVKLQGTELRHELEGLAIDVMGELGLAYGDNPYLEDKGSWQSQYMFFLGLIIGGGTSQIQKNIISERGLGMPKEPKVQAG